MYIRAANDAPPPLALAPLGVAVLAATEPADGVPEGLLVVLPVPHAVFTDWKSRREDLATQLTYRLIAAVFRVLGSVGAADAPVNYQEVYGNLAVSVWLGDHKVEADLREHILEAISTAYEEATELWAAGVEVYAVWVRAELLAGVPE